jgi:hypothetical protein
MEPDRFEAHFKVFLSTASLPTVKTLLELVAVEVLSRGLMAREYLSGAVLGLATTVIPSTSERRGLPRR